MFILFIAIFILLVALLELLQRYVFTSIIWTRKVLHVAAGFIIIFLPYYLTTNEIVVISVLFAVFFGLSKKYKWLSLHKVSRPTIGEVLYPLSIGIIAIISLPGHVEAFQFGTLTLSLGDGLATIIGQRWPIKSFNLLNGTKSLGGSLAFFIATTILLVVFFKTPLQLYDVILGSVLLLTMAEFVLIWGVDNLVIPVLATTIYIWYL